MAQLAYCEIKATIAQIESRGGYLMAAFSDDGTGGIRKTVRPALSADEKLRATKGLLELFQTETAGVPAVRLRRGRIAEEAELEGTATERRHFDFGEFLTIGVPDAFVQDDLIVEFASSRQPYLTARDKRLQANVYAVLWRVPRYRVIVVHPTSAKRVVLDETSDATLAEQTISWAWTLCPWPPWVSGMSRS